MAGEIFRRVESSSTIFNDIYGSNDNDLCVLEVEMRVDIDDRDVSKIGPNDYEVINSYPMDRVSSYERLMEKGAYFSEKSSSVLEWASDKDHVDVVKFMVDNGAVYKYRDYKEEGPNAMAVRMCDLDLLKVFERKMGRPEGNRIKLLDVATKKNCGDVVEHVLSNLNNPELLDSKRDIVKTWAMNSINHCNFPMFKMVLGDTLNRADDKFKRELTEEAVRNNCDSIVRYMLGK